MHHIFIHVLLSGHDSGALLRYSSPYNLLVGYCRLDVDMVSKPKGKRTQVLGYYEPGTVKQLQLLSKLTRVPQSVYLREALDDLLRKYSVLRRGR